MRDLKQENFPNPPDYTQMHEAAASPVTVTITDARSRLGISRSEIYRLLGAGKLRAVKSGARTLILWASILAYVETLPPAKFGTESEAGR